ncbi:PadR family transcriptional regulator [Clostridium brassicae]|uniref:PadR family transcriptional regulator n=1 Tax=Clostridium brassicae TaxID=2999072 RepID=A0ABT4DC59_9CLOT|nr:PadR family transcriptional regulator [Clostridium brassicae]MCY6959894.1 PadR family transcriptional regulator [Clostridium brassicae]
MIKAFILYYLSIKPTHGYEIQKFIQANHMDSWTKIQSGSIYYAINKLEKEGLIELLKKENIGAKERKIYKMTSKGQLELQQCLKEELNKEIYDIGSDKFIIYPILNGIEKKEIVAQVQRHIKLLKAKKERTREWQKIKVKEQTLKVEAVCFEMMLSSLDYQIKWHETLLEEIDSCMLLSKQISDFIKEVDFSTVEDMDKVMKCSNQQLDIEGFKQEILDTSNPQKAAEKLEELIKMLKK